MSKPKSISNDAKIFPIVLYSGRTESGEYKYTIGHFSIEDILKVTANEPQWATGDNDAPCPECERIERKRYKP